MDFPNQKNIPLRENSEIGNFAKTQGNQGILQNTGKGLCFEVLNSVILKIKNIALFSLKLPNLLMCLSSQFCIYETSSNR